MRWDGLKILAMHKTGLQQLCQLVCVNAMCDFPEKQLSLIEPARPRPSQNKIISFYRPDTAEISCPTWQLSFGFCKFMGSICDAL